MRYWQSSDKKPKPKRARKRPGKRSIASGGSIKQYPFLRAFYQHQAVISVGLQKFLFFFTIATLLYVFVFGDAGAIRIMSLKKDKATLEESLARLESNAENIRADIASVKKDPFQMEKIGRERYGYVYPGDRVYKLVHRHVDQ